MTVDLRIPHSRWCPARSRRGHPERGFDEDCPRCLVEKGHDYLLHRYWHKPGERPWECRPCEMHMTLATQGLVRSFTETPAEREAKARKAFAR